MRERDPQRRWLLRRPRRPPRFVEDVIDDGGDEERWMLLQDDETPPVLRRDVLEGEESPTARRSGCSTAARCASPTWARLALRFCDVAVRRPDQDLLVFTLSRTDTTPCSTLVSVRATVLDEPARPADRGRAVLAGRAEVSLAAPHSRRVLGFSAAAAAARPRQGEVCVTSPGRLRDREDAGVERRGLRGAPAWDRGERDLALGVSISEPSGTLLPALSSTNFSCP